MNTNGRQIKNQDAKNYITAGKAILTVVGKSDRFTFKVVKSDGHGPAAFFVKVLTGPDNGSNYSYLGCIYHDGSYRRGCRSKIGANAQSNIAFTWVWSHIENLPESVEVWHEGCCVRCGRRLTVPQSIEMGIGPYCAGLVQ